MTKQSLPKGRFSVSLRGFSAVELFKVTDPWTTQSLSEVLVNKYGRVALETKSGYQVFLSDKRLTAQQMDDLVFCSASTQGNRWGCSSQKQSQHQKNRSARVLLQSIMDCLKRPNLHCHMDSYKLLPPAAIC